MNRITNHQYFGEVCGEAHPRPSAKSTEDGFCRSASTSGSGPKDSAAPWRRACGGYEIYESWGRPGNGPPCSARPWPGTRQAGVLDRIAPFVYRKYLDFSAIAEVREMKQKINKDVQQKGKTRDVKLGHGGIREIEFPHPSAPAHLLSGRDRGAPEKNSSKRPAYALPEGTAHLPGNGRASRAMCSSASWSTASRSSTTSQTQNPSRGEHELRQPCPARAISIREKRPRPCSGLYRAHARSGAFTTTSSAVRLSLSRNRRSGSMPFSWTPKRARRKRAMVLAQYGFWDPPRPYRTCCSCAKGRPSCTRRRGSRKLFTELFPVLFKEVLYSPDPDMALNHLESFLAAQGSWDVFQSLVRQDLLAVKSLIAIFSNSQYFSRMLVQGPGFCKTSRKRTGNRGLARPQCWGKSGRGPCRSRRHHRQARRAPEIQTSRRDAHRHDDSFLRSPPAPRYGTACRVLPKPV